MSKTISFHVGSNWSRGHNIRDERYTRKQEHIDSTLTQYNVVICDIPVRQAYEEIFGQAVEEYNAKQKRSDRQIDDYYKKIKNDKRKHTVYECIVQIGDRKDTGNNAELERAALVRYAKEWSLRNPNLRLIGAYVHCDEPNGTVHAHIDFIPVATCTRGMSIQNSLDRALTQQGFRSESIHKTAQIAWQDSERKALYSICQDLNIDAQYGQNITKGRRHFDTPEYQEYQDEIDALKSRKAELEDSVFALIEDSDVLEAYVDDLKTQRDEQAEEIIDQEKQIDECKKELAEIQSTKVAISAHLDDIKITTSVGGKDMIVLPKGVHGKDFVEEIKRSRADRKWFKEKRVKYAEMKKQVKSFNDYTPEQLRQIADNIEHKQAAKATAEAEERERQEQQKHAKKHVGFSRDQLAEMAHDINGKHRDEQQECFRKKDRGDDAR